MGDLCALIPLLLDTFDTLGLSAPLLKSITEMGHYLKKKVIAEYVSSEAILNTVTHIGVDYAQGYQFGMPVMLDQLDLRSNPRF